MEELTLSFKDWADATARLRTVTEQERQEKCFKRSIGLAGFLDSRESPNPEVQIRGNYFYLKTPDGYVVLTCDGNIETASVYDYPLELLNKPVNLKDIRPFFTGRRVLDYLRAKIAHREVLEDWD